MTAAPKKRGRPRSFEPAVVLERATDAFLRFGYAGASLETLTTAMGVNKPSLYAEFGNKRRLFFRVIEERATALGKRYRAAFQRGDTLESSIKAMLDEAVDINVGESLPPGCLIVSASTTEAVVDEGLAQFTREFFTLCDQVVARWIEKTYAPRGVVSAAVIARLLNGVIHDISLRARVGEPEAKLRIHAREAAIALTRAAS